jgi:multiple sugar transport system permease protein
MDDQHTKPRILTHLLLVVGAFLMLYPLIWLVSSAFKPQNIIFTDPSLLPTNFTLENFSYGWDALRTPFGQFFLNSFFITGLIVVGNVLSCSITAFAFARLDFAFKRVWFALMLGTIMLPFHVTVIPQYILFNSLNWINTYYPLIVPHFFAVDAFFIFLNVQFIRGIPTELDEAAKVDGAGAFRIYRSIIIPLSSPALITTAIFTFIWNWDNFFGHLLYISNVSRFTVPLGLRSFLDSTGESNFGPLLAMSVLSLIPVFLFFIFAQRRLVEGISTTGFKG